MIELCRMSFRIVLPCFLLIFANFVLSDPTGICSEQVQKTKNVVIPFNRTYMETYQECRMKIFCKTKRRPRTKTDARISEVHYVDTVQKCCTGYIRSSYEHEPIQCEPVCVPSCVDSYCDSPGVCKCNDGYLPSSIKNQCKPYCPLNCTNGKCTAPHTCSCNFGFKMENESCHPICTDPCVNATCTAPDTCTCLPGYRQSSNHHCDPYCSSGCLNGNCIQPEICRCDEGYKLEDGRCVPVCDDCTHGICDAPNVCQCADGYRSENHTCVPVCTNCMNGDCVAPEVCNCNVGYRTHAGECVPQCSNIDCSYGTCVGPNVCECSSGFVMEPISKNSCVPFCYLCEGICEAPGRCVIDNEDRIVFPDYSENDFISTVKETFETGETFVTSSIDDFTESIASDSPFSINSTPTDEITTEAKQVDSARLYYWIYGVITLILVVLCIVAAVVVRKRKALTSCCSRGHYTVEDTPKVSFGPTQSSDVKLVVLSKKNTLDGVKRKS